MTAYNWRAADMIRLMIALGCISAVVAMALLIVFVVFGNVAVLDGRCPLTIVVNHDGTLSVDSTHFTTCWNDFEAEAAMQVGESSEIHFDTAETVAGDRVTVSVPWSGRVGPLGIEYSYASPKYVVVEFLTRHNDEVSTIRKRIEIPEGRGARVVQVTVP